MFLNNEQLPYKHCSANKSTVHHLYPFVTVFSIKNTRLYLTSEEVRLKNKVRKLTFFLFDMFFHLLDKEIDPWQ